MSALYLHANTLNVWEKSFEPYLDESQWPPYYGEDYVPYPDLRVAQILGKTNELAYPPGVIVFH